MRGKVIVLVAGMRWVGEGEAEVKHCGELVELRMRGNREGESDILQAGHEIRRAAELGYVPVASFTCGEPEAPVRRLIMRLTAGYTEGNRSGWSIVFKGRPVNLRSALVTAPGPFESPLVQYLTAEEREKIEGDLWSGRYDVQPGDASLIDVGLYLFHGEYTADLIERAREAGYRGPADRIEAALWLRGVPLRDHLPSVTVLIERGLVTRYEEMSDGRLVAVEVVDGRGPGNAKASGVDAKGGGL